jgi:hypothetical protein
MAETDTLDKEMAAYQAGPFDDAKINDNSENINAFPIAPVFEII